VSAKSVLPVNQSLSVKTEDILARMEE